MLKRLLPVGIKLAGSIRTEFGSSGQPVRKVNIDSIVGSLVRNYFSVIRQRPRLHQFYRSGKVGDVP